MLPHTHTHTHTQALKFMGTTLTPEQGTTIHTKLDVDKNGKVIFSDFVNLAREMFAFKMESGNLEAGLVLALTQKENMDLPSYPRKVFYHREMD